MTGDPTTDAVLAFLPDRWKPYALLGLLALVVLCKGVTVLVAPPTPGTRWAGIYAVISKIGLNVGWAVNAYQAGRQPIMVPVGTAPPLRTEIAAKLDIPREQTKP